MGKGCSYCRELRLQYELNAKIELKIKEAKEKELKVLSNVSNEDLITELCRRMNEV
jgi:hypothetical protein